MADDGEKNGDDDGTGGERQQQAFAMVTKPARPALDG
jgi:hypothetical protein